MKKLAQEFAFGNRAKKTMDAYPDYSKSIVSQRWRDPEGHGRNMALGSGVLGAALGVAIARALSNKASALAAGGAAGAAIGAIPGYYAGKQEAESENSRMLYLRRHLGINKPGEYEALLRFPERPLGAIVNERNEKAASVSSALNFLRTNRTLHTLAGAGAGYIAGHEGMSRLGGYSDDSQASRISGLMMGTAGGLLGNAFHIKDPAQKLKGVQSAIAAGLSGELVPTAVRTMNRVSKSTSDLAAATAQGAKRSLGGVLADAAVSPTAKGMGVGVGLAGLGALGTGLTRAKTDEEIQEGRTRTGMVGRDFLKFVIPALAAGGAIGSIRQ